MWYLDTIPYFKAYNNYIHHMTFFVEGGVVRESM
jgi:hypothetical protein